MRLMILRAALFAADADLGAGAPDVQASAPGQPPAPVPTTGGVQGVGLVAFPTAGRIVMVREHGKVDAPAIIVTVDSDGLIDCSVFRADHSQHAAHKLTEIDPANATARGWYWPKRS